MATFTLTPDYVYEEEIGFNVLQTRFENSVTQRRVKGSATPRKFKLSFVHRSKVDYEYARDFIIARRGPYEAFDFVNSLDGNTYSVVFVGGSFKTSWRLFNSYNFDFSVEEDIQ